MNYRDIFRNPLLLPIHTSHPPLDSVQFQTWKGTQQRAVPEVDSLYNGE